MLKILNTKMSCKIFSLLFISFVFSESTLCKIIPITVAQPNKLKGNPKISPNEDKSAKEAQKCSMFEQLLNHIKHDSKKANEIIPSSLSEILKFKICDVKSVDLTEEESYLDFKTDESVLFGKAAPSTIKLDSSKKEAKISSIAASTSLLNNGEILHRTKRSKRYASIFKFAAAEEKCEGSLVISHDSRNGVALDDFSKLRLKGEKFPMLKRLSDREIFRIEVDGNCSWKLFSRPGFRGRSEIITSTTYNPDFHPMSAMKIQ